jgi:hypothetical protein
MVVLEAVMSVTSSSAQDMPHFFTPYAFQLPILSKGEYVFSSWGFYYSSKFSTSDDYDSKDKRLALNMLGVYALTDQFLLRVGLTYLPTQNVGSARYANSDFAEKRDETLKDSIEPDITLVFRPSHSLEVYGTYLFGSQTTKYDYRPVTVNGTEQSYFDYKYAYFGVTFHGKL